MILSCGLLTLDVVQTVAQVPTANQKTVALSSDVDFGGPAANAAAVAAALGSTSGLLSYLGAQPSAQVVGQLVESSGVRFQRLSCAELGNSPQVPVSTVLVTEGSGERAVVSSHGLVDARLALPAGDLLTGVDVVLLDGHYLVAAIDLARRAQALGIPVVFDGGSWKPGLENLLPLVDVAILSADFSGKVPCRFVARSHGGGPIEFHGSSIPVAQPPKIVDTLGAGDVLHGAFVHFIAGSALTECSVRNALKQAAEVATYSCEFAGARGWTQTWPRNSNSN